MEFDIRKAGVGDVPEIYELLKHVAGQGLLLPRSLSNLYEMVQSFWVAAERESGQVIGVAALQVAWEDLGEVRSLAVDEKRRGLDLGRRLVAAVEAEAKKLGVARMFTLTYVPDFFAKLGYRQVPLESLPQKIWAVCFQCVHYPDCKEIALIKDFKPAA